MKHIHIKKWLRNPKVKLYSFLFALLLWFFIVTGNDFNHTVHVKLRLINQPAGWIPTYPLPEKAEVQFKGTGQELMKLSSRDLTIELDMEQTKKDVTFPVTIEAVQGIPKGSSLEPVQVIHPTSVRVRLDQFAKKVVSIRSQIHLHLMDGYIQVGEVQLEPDSTSLHGPKSLVDAIEYVFTDSVQFENVMKEIKGKIDLASPDVETIQYAIQSVRFQCDVQRIGERIITEIPVVVTNVPKNLKVMVVPSTFSLTLQGGVKILARLQKADIEATIDYRYRQRYGGKKSPANIRVPSGITFAESKPSSFELFVE